MARLFSDFFHLLLSWKMPETCVFASFHLSFLTSTLSGLNVYVWCKFNRKICEPDFLGFFALSVFRPGLGFSPNVEQKPGTGEL